ncbi:MAG: hypothetical protein CMF80_07800 [Candidatus Marinimicrobia bacterium]|nr:hypothetical protein [Candidatus Neomarinimicrobiota bacterium]|tara:strand:- start:2989 stop:3468 length:480 start_codon:yes stop_codon:yes gene_type:complete
MNGRVDIEKPNINTLFDLKDKIPIESSDFRDALNGNIITSDLSVAYFSKENIRIIQNGLRVGVYNLSKGSYIISPQNEDNLKVIMRSIFLQNSANLPNNIKEQINELNSIVLDYCIPKVYGEAKGYLTYLHDVSNLAIPMERPESSTYKTNTLQTNPFI